MNPFQGLSQRLHSLDAFQLVIPLGYSSLATWQLGSFALASAPQQLVALVGSVAFLAQLPVALGAGDFVGVVVVVVVVAAAAAVAAARPDGKAWDYSAFPLSLERGLQPLQSPVAQSLFHPVQVGQFPGSRDPAKEKKGGNKGGKNTSIRREALISWCSRQPLQQKTNLEILKGRLMLHK